MNEELQQMTICRFIYGDRKAFEMGERGNCPPYCRSSDAIMTAVALAVERLGYEFQSPYTIALEEITQRRRRDCNDLQKIFWLYEATSLQRCEAFLKAVNLWPAPERVNEGEGKERS